MAFTNNGTSLDKLSSGLIPQGATIPSITKITSASGDPYYKNWAIPIDKSTVATASKATTFDAIVAAVTAAVTTRVELYEDDVANTIVGSTEILNIVDNQDLANEFYTNVAAAYIVTVDVNLNFS